MKKILYLLLFFPVLQTQAQQWEKNYDYTDNFACGLAKVKKNNQTGYVNNKGTEIVKLQYQDGLAFSEGYAAVKKDDQWLFLDSTGKAITEPIFDDALSFSGGLAPVAKNGLYGYINMAGQLVIAFAFAFTNAHNFTEGLAPASNTKRLWGYVDAKGNWVIAPVYDYTECFANGEARVNKNSKTFYIDKRNNVLHE